MSNEIKFVLNEPQVLKLSDPTGDLDGLNVLYPTADGKILSLPQYAAAKLNGLFLEPGEEVSIAHYRKIAGEPAEWVFALTPRTEKMRAEKEQSDLERQLAESLKIQEIPQPKATGTHGPEPARRIKPQILPRTDARTPPPRVSYRLALRDITQAVTGLLRDSGEQWNDQAKQDLISTAFISAAKTGGIVFDFSPEEVKP